MPLTDTFLNTCRAKVLASAELAAVKAQATVAATADDRGDARAGWSALYIAGGLVERLWISIRQTVNAEADINAAGSATGFINASERESAVGTLSGEYVPDIERPATDAEDLAALKAALDEDYL